MHACWVKGWINNAWIGGRGKTVSVLGKENDASKRKADEAICRGQRAKLAGQKSRWILERTCDFW